MTKLYSQVGDNDGLCEGCHQPASTQTCAPVLLAGLGPGGGPAWGTMWLCPTCLDKEPHPRCAHGRGPGRCWCTPSSTKTATKAEEVSMSDSKDIKDLKLPTTTKEFAQWLRDIATQVDRISDRPLQLDENNVEIGFYYGNPMFPQKPTGLHFEVAFASTEYVRGDRKP